MQRSRPLRRYRGFAALCLLIPVVAMVATLIAVRDKPTIWRTQETLALPSVIVDKNPGSVSLWVAGFKEALDSPRLITSLSRSQSIPESKLDDELRSRQRGKSAQITITFDAQHSSGGGKVIDAAIKSALDVVAIPQKQALTAAGDERTAAGKTRDAARAAVTEVLGGTGVVNPPTELARARADLASAQADLAVAESANADRAAVLRAAIPALQKRVGDLQALAVAYQPLADKLDDAQGQLDAAVDRESTARIELESLLHPLPVGGTNVVRRPPGPAIRRSVLLAGAIGLAAAAGVVLFRVAGDNPGPFTPLSGTRREQGGPSALA
jgi:hypothetical protein